jgi:hypothetical protein
MLTFEYKKHLPILSVLEVVYIHHIFMHNSLPDNSNFITKQTILYQHKMIIM